MNFWNELVPKKLFFLNLKYSISEYFLQKLLKNTNYCLSQRKNFSETNAKTYLHLSDMINNLNRLEFHSKDHECSPKKRISRANFMKITDKNRIYHQFGTNGMLKL